MGAIAAGLVAVPSAGAATTVGQLAPFGQGPTTCTNNVTVIQNVLTSGNPYRMPEAGVITSWTVRTGAGSAGSTLQLKVVRSAGPAGTYMTVAQTPFAPMPNNTELTTAVGPPGIPVQQGDELSLRTGPAGSPPCLFSVMPPDAIWFSFTDVPPGSSGMYNPQSNLRLNVVATLEPDADGDALGDESQDGNDDNDAFPDSADNCRTTASGDQTNTDGDAEGDACDGDDDNDGVSDAVEASVGSNPRAVDSDGDGRSDGADACPTRAGTTANGCPDEAAPGVGVSGVPRRIARRRFVARGLPVTLNPNEAASFRLRLLGRLRGTSIARAGDVVVAERSLPLAAGRRTTRLRVPRPVRRRLARRLRLRLEVVATDAAGNRTTVTRRVAVR
jgi:Thrombospondin type 3 repeat